jgi:hypothetical protein
MSLSDEQKIINTPHNLLLPEISMAVSEQA